MGAEQLLYALTGIRGAFIREAAPGAAVPRRRRWPWAAALAACLCLVLLMARARPAASPESGADSPGDGAPRLTVDGVTYVVSAHPGTISVECPEGFTYAGETTVTYREEPLPYYTNPEYPEWVYVCQECYNQQTREYYMGYVRYVEEVLRGLRLLRYQGEVYVFLLDTQYLPYQTEVDPEDQARYDAVPYGWVVKEPPQGFEPVGTTVFDGYDLVPVSELGSNDFFRQQVLANPEEPDILLRRYYPDGLSGPEYWVFVRYQ